LEPGMASVSTRGSISLDEDVASAADRDVSSFSCVHHLYHYC
jgi:hypothetical protein